MKFLKIFILSIFLFSFGIAIAKNSQVPKISLSFPESFKANEEIEVLVSVSNLKNAPYDLKISIEKDKNVLSEIYNEKEGKWQSSLYYIKNLFSGPSFERKFKLRMKKEFLFFEGEAEIVVRVRENGKSSYIQTREKIKISKPEIKKEETKPQEILAEIPKNFENKKLSPKIIAILNSLSCAFIILILKLKLKSLQNEKH
jgi:hypothetical protein